MRYALTVTSLAVTVCVLAGAFAATAEQRAAATVLGMAMLGYTGFVAWRASRDARLPGHAATVRRVRVQRGLASRAWLEAGGRWYPVFFDPVLVTSASPAPALRRGGAFQFGDVIVYPAGRSRPTEPSGRLVDYPSRPAPDADIRARAAAALPRRLLLDGQFAIAGPFAGLLWVSVFGGGVTAFAAVTVVAAIAAIWFAAIRGSDPS